MRPAYKVALSVLFLAGIETIASGQAAVPPGPDNFYIGTPAGWKQPKTPWGDPDLQGIYPLNYVGSVPLQRCNGGGGGRGRAAAPCDPHKAFLTEQEYQALLDRSKNSDRYATQFKAAEQEGQTGREFLQGVTDPTTPQRQTSLIFDPPDGKLPEMTEEGKKIMAEMKSTWPLPGENPQFFSYHDFDTWEQCITRGFPVSMFPFRYDNGVQIIQAPGVVVIMLEMIHDARIVTLNDNTPIPDNITQWMGISRGHWEGNTLVIETSHIKPGASMTNTAVIASPAGNRWPESAKMHTTERITRLNNDFIKYEITVDDPVVMTHSWTAKFPLKRDPTYKLLEYTCHEDNEVIPDWISVTQAELKGEKKAPATQR